MCLPLPHTLHTGKRHSEASRAAQDWPHGLSGPLLPAEKQGPHESGPDVCVLFQVWTDRWSVSSIEVLIKYSPEGPLFPKDLVLSLFSSFTSIMLSVQLEQTTDGTGNTHSYWNILFSNLCALRSHSRAHSTGVQQAENTNPHLMERLFWCYSSENFLIRVQHMVCLNYAELMLTGRRRCFSVFWPWTILWDLNTPELAVSNVSSVLP